MVMASRVGLPLMHPAVLIATGLGSGLLPGAPGTWGSLAALPVAWAITAIAGPIALLLMAIVVFATGCWASDRVAVASGRADPGFIVIDEVAAQWLVLTVAPLDWRAYAVGFLLFRVFDITKPWPVNWAERSYKGGLGIMLDDVVAGLYALAILLIGEGALGVRP